MGELSERGLALFFELYESLPRQGPGSSRATREALSRLPGLPPRPRIADMGCGSGASSRVLADETGAMVVAIDIHAPFLARLRADGATQGRRGTVLPVAADIGKPPLAPASLDLVWSEGAIYQLGFAHGLQRWRPLLKAGGLLAVTEATWLVEDAPEPVRAFWATAYPAMTTISGNESTIAASGFRPLDCFVLTPDCWRDSYYAPLERALTPFLMRHTDDPDAAMIAAEVREEIELYRRYGGCYGYVFYLAEAVR